MSQIVMHEIKLRFMFNHQKETIDELHIELHIEPFNWMKEGLVYSKIRIFFNERE